MCGGGLGDAFAVHGDEPRVHSDQRDYDVDARQQHDGHGAQAAAEDLVDQGEKGGPNARNHHGRFHRLLAALLCGLLATVV